ncbi:hypothetical protein BDV35DRAFT_405715 [Aspergillus flavus]|uniref:Uncharacterized protein n=1 Tax=Aspergillus flavus TaxID=5059 RepID=A0A5N6GUL5_ASPFL|nr:hypothetical protein BDV35DRAFT_405715 [Aspergillus flavus]
MSVGIYDGWKKKPERTVMGHGDWSGQGSIVCFLVSLTISGVSLPEASVDLVQGYQDNHSPTWTSDPNVLTVNPIPSDQPPAIVSPSIDLTQTNSTFCPTELGTTAADLSQLININYTVDFGANEQLSMAEHSAACQQYDLNMHSGHNNITLPADISGWSGINSLCPGQDPAIFNISNKLASKIATFGPADLETTQTDISPPNGTDFLFYRGTNERFCLPEENVAHPQSVGIMLSTTNTTLGSEGNRWSVIN